MIARENRRNFSDRLAAYRARVEMKLATELRERRAIPDRLVDAIEYSVLGPGKRIRPLLCYAAGEMFDVALEPLDAIAAAVELVHAYSLVHDDLPAMDDDDLRRGRPTTHRAFDEATAILAGDGLQALAFELLCGDVALGADPVAQMRVIKWLARASGPAGMVGGQMLDLQAEGHTLDESSLEDIHRRKTGELICASIMMPAELSVASERDRALLEQIARDIGLMFQIRDDLLEIDHDTATLGKNARSDAENNKSTYPSLLGVRAARERAEALHSAIVTGLNAIGRDATGLEWIANFVHGRGY
jgi:geranylgeranyl diphosphate synthase type II